MTKRKLTAYDDDGTINFDLDKMEEALKGPFYKVPDHVKTSRQFRDWMKHIAETEPNEE